MRPKVLNTAAAPTQSAEFRRWFGDSKVVTTNGEPLVVYHGFTRGDSEQLRPGSFFAYERELAEDYAEGGHVGAFYLALIKPLVLSTPAQVRDAWEMAGAFVTGIPFHGLGDSSQARLRQWAMREGYDGIMVEPSAFEGEDGYREAGGTFGEPQLIAFRSEQIKSADRNSGAYDPDEARFALKRRGEPDEAVEEVRECAPRF